MLILNNHSNGTLDAFQINMQSCINKSLFEMHTSSIINFTRYDYIKHQDKHMPTYEIVLKIVLCLVSISASLFGNILVIYTILIKPYLKQNYFKNQFDLYVSNNNESLNYNQFIMHKKYSADFDFSRVRIRERNQSEANIYNLNLNNENTEIRTEKKLIVTRSYKPCKNKPVNLFILNLCFCDLMIVLWCSWVHMVNSISENWKMGAFFCRFNTFVQGKIKFLLKSKTDMSYFRYRQK